MKEDFSNKTVDSVIRSLISAKEFALYEKTGQYNLGSGFLNRMIIDLESNGYLTETQQNLLKKRLASCELNIHLDDVSGAKRYGPFVSLPGGLDGTLVAKK